MLIQDYYLLENLQIIEESKNGSKVMKVKGIFQRADEQNNNKRIYPRKLLEREVIKLSEKITNRTLVGELDHPEKDSVKLANASHLITGLSLKGNEVIGEAEILSTPAGMVAQSLIKGGVKIGISSRGLGTLTENEDGTKTVNEDFNLVTWDLVADPSTRGAYPGLKESLQENSNLCNSILCEEFSKLNQEKLLVEYLKIQLKEGLSEDTAKRKARQFSRDTSLGVDNPTVPTKRKNNNRRVKKFISLRKDMVNNTKDNSKGFRTYTAKFAKVKRARLKQTQVDHTIYPLIRGLLEGSMGTKRLHRKTQSLIDKIGGHRKYGKEFVHTLEKSKYKFKNSEERLNQRNNTLERKGLYKRESINWQDKEQVNEVFKYFSQLKQRLFNKADPRTRAARSGLRKLYKQGGSKALGSSEAEAFRIDRKSAAIDRLRKKGYKIGGKGSPNRPQTLALNKVNAKKAGSNFKPKSKILKHLDLAHTVREGSMGTKRLYRKSRGIGKAYDKALLSHPNSENSIENNKRHKISKEYDRNYVKRVFKHGDGNIRAAFRPVKESMYPMIEAKIKKASKDKLSGTTDANKNNTTREYTLTMGKYKFHMKDGKVQDKSKSKKFAQPAKKAE